MNRRQFVRQTTLIAFTVAAVPRAVRAGATLLPVSPLDCEPTTDDILGPFYRANAPFRTDLTVPGDPGTPIVIRGMVRSEDCSTPLTTAVVDIWQANDAGQYDNTSPEFRYRGRIETGADGLYAMTTILPGKYLNGAQYRPRHIHFRVTAPGHQELITQLYFQGDTSIPADPWASQPDAALRIVPLVEENGVQVAVFDIALDNVSSAAAEPEAAPWLIIQRNPFGERLGIAVENGRIRDVELFSSAGVLVAAHYDVDRSEFLLPGSQLRSGHYYLRVQTTDGRIGLRRVVKK
jgi:catechol 1,2-dioxygenase